MNSTMQATTRPTMRPSTNQPQTSAGGEDQMASPLILVIEDDSQIRRFLRATLSNLGYKLLEATTAQEGMNQVAMRHPDLIILDLGLPDKDGLEVTRSLREWTNTPIIVLSARD